MALAARLVFVSHRAFDDQSLEKVTVPWDFFRISRALRVDPLFPFNG